MTSVKCKGDFVELVDGEYRTIIHRSQVILALDSKNNCVAVGAVNNDHPIIVKPENGMTAEGIYIRFSEEITGIKQ